MSSSKLSTPTVFSISVNGFFSTPNFESFLIPVFHTPYPNSQYRISLILPLKYTQTQEITNTEKTKARINHVVLDYNWKSWYELTVLYRKHTVAEYACALMGISVCTQDYFLTLSTEKAQKQPWLVWLSGLRPGMWTERLPVQFQVRAHAWVAGQVPSWGRGNRSMYISHTDVSLSFSKRKDLEVIMSHYLTSNWFLRGTRASWRNG